jgi:hypothetical protein
LTRPREIKRFLRTHSLGSIWAKGDLGETRIFRKAWPSALNATFYIAPNVYALRYVT